MATELLALLATVALQGDGPLPSAEKALELAIKQRQSITKFAGTFKFVRDESAPKKAGAKEFSTVSARRFWLDGIQLREDRFVADRIQSIQCRNCEKAGQFIRFHNVKIGANPVMIELGTMPGDGVKGDPNYRNLFFTDPRVFGLQPSISGVLHAFKIDTMLGRADRTPPILEKTKWNGYDAYIIRFVLTTGDKAKYAYWLVPAMDYSVVRVDGESESMGRKTSLSLKSEMERHGKPGIWFPKSYVAESHIDGKLAWSDTVSVTDVTINQPLPADTFRLAGMNIPAGWPIKGSALPDKTKQYEWDGKKIVERGAPKGKAPPDEASSAPPGSSQRGLFLTGAGVLALGGTVALALAYRKR